MVKPPFSVAAIGSAPLTPSLRARESEAVDAFVFNGSPQAFDKDVVLVAALTVHADPNAVLFETSGKRLTDCISCRY